MYVFHSEMVPHVLVFSFICGRTQGSTSWLSPKMRSTHLPVAFRLSSILPVLLSFKLVCFVDMSFPCRGPPTYAAHAAWTRLWESITQERLHKYQHFVTMESRHSMSMTGSNDLVSLWPLAYRSDPENKRRRRAAVATPVQGPTLCHSSSLCPHVLCPPTAPPCSFDSTTNSLT